MNLVLLTIPSRSVWMCGGSSGNGGSSSSNNGNRITAILLERMGKGANGRGAMGQGSRKGKGPGKGSGEGGERPVDPEIAFLNVMATQLIMMAYTYGKGVGSAMVEPGSIVRDEVNDEIEQGSIARDEVNDRGDEEALRLYSERLYSKGSIMKGKGAELMRRGTNLDPDVQRVFGKGAKGGKRRRGADVHDVHGADPAAAGSEEVPDGGGWLGWLPTPDWPAARRRRLDDADAAEADGWAMESDGSAGKGKPGTGKEKGTGKDKGKGKAAKGTGKEAQ